MPRFDRPDWIVFDRTPRASAPDSSGSVTAHGSSARAVQSSRAATNWFGNFGLCRSRSTRWNRRHTYSLALIHRSCPSWCLGSDAELAIPLSAADSGSLDRDLGQSTGRRRLVGRTRDRIVLDEHTLHIRSVISHIIDSLDDETPVGGAYWRRSITYLGPHRCCTWCGVST